MVPCIRFGRISGGLVLCLHDANAVWAHHDLDGATGPDRDLDRHCADLHRAIAVPYSVQPVGPPDEGCDERRCRLFVDLDRRSDLLELAAFHHHDLVAHGQGFDLIVRDEDRRDAEPLLDVADLVAHLVAQFGIEIGQAVRRAAGSMDE